MRAGEVMAREVTTVTRDTTVAEAVDLMRRTRHGTLPVVDDEGLLVGVITKADLIRRCLPEYLAEVGDLFRREEFGPFQERIAALGMLAVSELMITEFPTAAEDTPLGEVAALMLTRSVRQVPILRAGRLVGLVGMQDIVDLIARAASGRGQGPPP